MVQPTVENARKIMKELQRVVAELDFEIHQDARMSGSQLGLLNLTQVRYGCNLYRVSSYARHLADQPGEWEEQLFRLTHELARLKTQLAELRVQLRELQKPTVASDRPASAEEMMLLQFDLRKLRRHWLEEGPVIARLLDALPDQPSALPHSAIKNHKSKKSIPIS